MIMKICTQFWTSDLFTVHSYNTTLNSWNVHFEQKLASTNYQIVKAKQTNKHNHPSNTIHSKTPTIHFTNYMGVSKIVVPQMENPIKMDDLRVTLFSETSILSLHHPWLFFCKNHIHQQTNTSWDVHAIWPNYNNLKQVRFPWNSRRFPETSATEIGVRAQVVFEVSRIWPKAISTIPKTNSSPVKIGRNPKGNEKVFQTSIFRCENVCFREGTRSTNPP